MENESDTKKVDKFLDGVLVFLELCGKHPELTKEFIEKLRKAESEPAKFNLMQGRK